MHVVDPMHNLLLGVTKTALKVWIKHGFITKEKLLLIDKKQQHLNIPDGVGRIARVTPAKRSQGQMLGEKMGLCAKWLSLFFLLPTISSDQDYTKEFLQ